MISDTRSLNPTTITDDGSTLARCVPVRADQVFRFFRPLTPAMKSHPPLANPIRRSIALLPLAVLAGCAMSPRKAADTASPMKQYTLLDGAMLPGGIELDASWLEPLMSQEELRAVGPILVSHSQIAERPDKKFLEAKLSQLAASYPQGLHAASISSPLELDALAKHLRQFVYAVDSSGEYHILRIADGRVMGYLPGVLTLEQWDAITAPIETWHIHDRRGSTIALQLNESRRECSGSCRPLQLDDEQIKRLVEEAEPDALLANVVGRDTATFAAEKMQWYYDVARHCIKAWKDYIGQSGQDDPVRRGLLYAFSRRVFKDDGAWINDGERVKRELDAVSAVVGGNLDMSKES